MLQSLVIIISTVIVMASNDVFLDLFLDLERRVTYLESQMSAIRQTQPLEKRLSSLVPTLTMQELHERRQAKLDYYRQQYEGPQHIRNTDDAEDEID